MLRLFIADDEFLVLESLKQIITSAYNNIEIVGTAMSGREAIEKSETLYPDLILMDIKMPGIDGIEAIRQIRERNKNVQFIIISAYEHFDFAREGIKLGVIDYITKPFNATRIKACLNKAMLKIDDIKTKKTSQIEMREKLSKVLPHLENQFIYSRIFTGSKLRDLRYYEDIFGMELSDSLIISAVITNHEDSIENSLKAQKLYNLIAMEIKNEFKSLSGPSLLDKYIALIVLDKSEKPYEFRNRVLETLKTIHNRVNQLVKIDFRIGVGRIHDIESIYDSYKESIKAIDTTTEEPVVLFEDLIQGETEIIYDTKIHYDQLVEAYKSNDYERFKLYFDQELMGEFKKSTIDEVIGYLIEILIKLKKTKVDNNRVYNSEERKMLRKILKSTDLKEIRDEFICFMKPDIKSNQAKVVQKIDSTIKKVYEFIEANYSENISLQDIAEEINMSYYYFSRFFKEQTGANFSDYLNDYRIGKAKTFLKETDKSIKEVCFDIGYNDPNYFSKIFKKLVGKSPSEYRNDK